LSSVAVAPLSLDESKSLSGVKTQDSRVDNMDLSPLVALWPTPPFVIDAEMDALIEHCAMDPRATADLFPVPPRKRSVVGLSQLIERDMARGPPPAFPDFEMSSGVPEEDRSAQLLSPLQTEQAGSSAPARQWGILHTHRDQTQHGWLGDPFECGYCKQDQFRLYTAVRDYIMKLAEMHN